MLKDIKFGYICAEDSHRAIDLLSGLRMRGMRG